MRSQTLAATTFLLMLVCCGGNDGDRGASPRPAIAQASRSAASEGRCQKACDRLVVLSSAETARVAATGSEAFTGGAARGFERSSKSLRQTERACRDACAALRDDGLTTCMESAVDSEALIACAGKSPE